MGLFRDRADRPALIGGRGRARRLVERAVPGDRREGRRDEPKDRREDRRTFRRLGPGRFISAAPCAADRSIPTGACGTVRGASAAAVSPIGPHPVRTIRRDR